MFSVSFTVINKYGKGGAVQISTVFCPPYMVLVEGSYEKGLLERFDSQRFSESVISDIHQLSGSSLSRCSKFKLHLKNAEKKWGNVFSFFHNCTWIGCLKLSLLRREYFSLVVHMLGNILKTFHITKRHFV